MASVLRPQFGQIFVRILKFRDPKFRDPNFREFPKIFSFSVREASVAKKVGGGGGGKGAGKAKKLLEVETDPHKLVNFVCGSNYKLEGEDVQIKPDSEYPDWLFTMDMTRPKPSSFEMENKGTIEYWLRVREEQLIKHRRLQKLKMFGVSNRK